MYNAHHVQISINHKNITSIINSKILCYYIYGATYLALITYTLS